MQHLVPLLALLLFPAAAGAQSRSASVYYFDHDYRISFDLSKGMEEVFASSAAAGLKLEKVSTEITYTNGGMFLLDGPEDLNAHELNATTSYAPAAEAEVLEGGSSVLVPPADLADTFAPALEEAMSAYLSVERKPAAVLEGLSPSGIRFTVLRTADRAVRPLWEPTLKMRYQVSSPAGRREFTAFSIPMGLNGLNRRMVENAADKGSAAVLSLGAGGALAGVVLKAGPARTFAYMSAAGTDIAALDLEDLGNFWQWHKAGELKLSTAAPEFICTNLRISDPELAKVIKPYALRSIGGQTVAFVSLVPSRSAAQLAGTPFEVTDPGDPKALYAVLNELRGARKAKAIIAVSYLDNDELGWLLGARGIDALIGPKTWDLESGRRTRVEMLKWDKEAHTGPALTVFPDSRGSGVIRMEFGRRGALEALMSLPPPEDDREPLLYREQVYMKERIVRYFLGSGDALLPDLRGRGAGQDYTIPSFFNLAAALLRGSFGAEAAVLKVTPFSNRVLGDIPTSMVKSWLGPDEPVELALVPGFHLAALVKQTVPDAAPGEDLPENYKGAAYYAVSGTDRSGRLAGLPINPDETYLVAMPASLAAGKTFIKILKRPAGAPETLHAAVTGALEREKKASPSRSDWEDAVLEASRNITRPRSVWRLNLRNLSLQMVNTGVDGPGGYAQVGESRLSAVNQTQMQGSLRLFSELYSEKFRLDAGVSADYGKTVLRPKDQPRLTTESVDQLVYSGELVYRWRKFDGKLGKLVVGPYASAAYDTEFSRVEDLPLRKVLRGGAGFKLFEGAAVQELYAGLSTEQVYTYLPARLKHALETGFRMAVPLPGTALTLNADGNYRLFARSRFDTVYDLKERLELNLRMSTRLYGDVMISPFLNYFLASGKKLPGSAYNLTAGFALEYSRLFKLKR